MVREKLQKIRQFLLLNQRFPSRQNKTAAWKAKHKFGNIARLHFHGTDTAVP